MKEKKGAATTSAFPSKPNAWKFFFLQSTQIFSALALIEKSSTGQTEELRTRVARLFTNDRKRIYKLMSDIEDVAEELHDNNLFLLAIFCNQRPVG